MIRLLTFLLIFLVGIAWSTISGYYLKDAWDKWRAGASVDQDDAHGDLVTPRVNKYRINESVGSLVEEIALQTRILNDHISKSADDMSYYKEIANKLFLLTGRSGEGLLLKLMNYYNHHPEFRLSGPGDRMTTLKQYLSTTCGAQRTPSGLREFTPFDLITIVAFEDGGVQKTSSIDEGYGAARDSGFEIAGDKAIIYQLKAIARTVALSASEFVVWIKSQPNLLEHNIRLD